MCSKDTKPYRDTLEVDVYPVDKEFWCSTVKIEGRVGNFCGSTLGFLSRRMFSVLKEMLYGGELREANSLPKYFSEYAAFLAPKAARL